MPSEWRSAFKGSTSEYHHTIRPNITTHETLRNKTPPIHNFQALRHSSAVLTLNTHIYLLIHADGGVQDSC